MHTSRAAGSSILVNISIGGLKSWYILADMYCTGQYLKPCFHSVISFNFLLFFWLNSLRNSKNLHTRENMHLNLLRLIPYYIPKRNWDFDDIHMMIFIWMYYFLDVCLCSWTFSMLPLRHDCDQLKALQAV